MYLCYAASTYMLQKFLVDNAKTMGDFWDEAAELLEVLVMKAKGLDPDGMDLSFTSGPINVRNKDDEKLFTEAMDNHNAKPNDTTPTDMSTPLGDILFSYLQDLKTGNKSRDNGNKKKKSSSSANERRKLTVIIFTDGIWDGMDNKAQVDNTIIDFSRELEKEVGRLQKRLVSIEFVQFGNDPDATHRLRHLDNDLRFSGVE
jgi:hypothetical protein